LLAVPFLALLVTQMLVPSNATPVGNTPTTVQQVNCSVVLKSVDVSVGLNATDSLSNKTANL